MSSSRVFKQDPHFTPTTLVRHKILPVSEQAEATTVAPLLSVSAAEAEPLAEQLKISSGNELPVQEEPKAQPFIDLEAIRQEAYNQGMADLAAQHQHEVRQAVAAFTESCQKIDHQRNLFLQHNQADLINLIMLLCEKIVRQELTTPRNIIAATLQSALEQAVSSEEYHVTVHPDDLAVAEQNAPELIAAIRGIEGIVFKADDTVTRGGCLLESAVCTVDATIETQLASLKEFVTEHALIPPLQPAQEITPPESSTKKISE